jgi:hypothetical protein
MITEQPVRSKTGGMHYKHSPEAYLKIMIDCNRYVILSGLGYFLKTRHTIDDNVSIFHRI